MSTTKGSAIIDNRTLRFGFNAANEWDNRRLYTLENLLNKIKTTSLNEPSGV